MNQLTLEINIMEITQDIVDVIFYDLDQLELKDTEENPYHFNLLRNNLLDLIGEPSKD